MPRSDIISLTALVMVAMALMPASAAREFAEEGTCDIKSLGEFQPDKEPNMWVEACPIPKEGVTPGRAPGGSGGPPALVPIACKLTAMNNGLNFLPTYPPHYCTNLCPAGTVPCCVWMNGGHSCRCYQRFCPISWGPPRRIDTPL